MDSGSRKFGVGFVRRMMNQQCKVCGEPAAGFHFGAFTCEGCKSFFGRSYNNLNSITECKNNGECIINKKNRTACKSCRLRKCLLVGMSKSGSRYGRRSNWFKIHCLLQEQQQAAVAHIKAKPPPGPLDAPLPLLSPLPLPFPHPNLPPFLRPTAASSPSVSSPDSDSSEPGIYPSRLGGGHPFAGKEFFLPVSFHSMFVGPGGVSSPFLVPPSLLPFRPLGAEGCGRTGSSCDLEEEGVRADSPPRRSPTNNNEYSSKCNNKHVSGDSTKNKCNDSCNDNDIVNNNNNINNNNNEEEDKVRVRSKRFYLDAILGLKSRRGSQEEEQSKSPKRDAFEEEQDNPIDLSLKRSSLKSDVAIQENGCQTDPEEEAMAPKIRNQKEELKPIPLDLSV